MLESRGNAIFAKHRNPHDSPVGRRIIRLPAFQELAMAVRRRSVVFVPAVLLLVPLIARVLVAAEPPPLPAAKQAGLAPHFMRLVDEGAAGGKLETADVTYKR